MPKATINKSYKANDQTYNERIEATMQNETKHNNGRKMTHKYTRATKHTLTNKQSQIEMINRYTIVETTNRIT